MSLKLSYFHICIIYLLLFCCWYKNAITEELISVCGSRGTVHSAGVGLVASNWSRQLRVHIYYHKHEAEKAKARLWTLWRDILPPSWLHLLKQHLKVDLHTETLKIWGNCSSVKSKKKWSISKKRVGKCSLNKPFRHRPSLKNLLFLITSVMFPTTTKTY